VLFRSGPLPMNEKEVRIRKARAEDMEAVINIDSQMSGQTKRDYWEEVFTKYTEPQQKKHFFVVAQASAEVIGYMVGEIRSWEFGAPPTGWILALAVKPEYHLEGVATKMLGPICDGFRNVGIKLVRTMSTRDELPILSFFRSQGMMAGRYIELEMRLD